MGQWYEAGKPSRGAAFDYIHRIALQFPQAAKSSLRGLRQRPTTSPPLLRRSSQQPGRFGLPFSLLQLSRLGIDFGKVDLAIAASLILNMT
jgi:hypothetical protein